jgi:hypothetical protein
MGISMPPTMTMAKGRWLSEPMLKEVACSAQAPAGTAPKHERPVAGAF